MLAAGAGTADAARSCSQDQVLIPYGSTANGSETDGYCIRAANDPIGQSRVDARYSEIATAIIKRFGKLKGIKSTDALVICWSQRDWNALSKTHAKQFGDGLGNIAGYVMMPWNVINLSPKTCTSWIGSLPGWQGDPRQVGLGDLDAGPRGAARRRDRDKAATECYAMQLTADTAHLLGESKPFGTELARSLCSTTPA